MVASSRRQTKPIKTVRDSPAEHRSHSTAMGGRRVRMWSTKLQLLILLSGALLSARASPTGDQAEEVTVTHPPPEQLESESRSQKEDVLDVDEDLDGRSAYVNNQFVPSEPVELLEDEQNAPLYEILQKQMEQVLASTGPNDPVYEHREKQDRRDQQPPNRPPPLFTSSHPNDAEVDDDYEDGDDRTDLGYSDQEKPDAASVLEDDEQTETGYQLPQPQKPSTTTPSTTRRPHKRRSTTAHPRTTRARTSAQPRATPKPANLTTISTTSSIEVTPPPTTPIPRPKASPSPSPNPRPLPNPSNSLPSDPQVYQHKRRIIFKTISTGSQFINSPIGDLMIKFSIGFARPAHGEAPVPSSEALRALSNNLLRNIELQKLKRANKVQRD
ncbi:actin cytoskeleton-regulatory complex protein pan1 [Drosophila pseudoobscura]|uniref:Actin cytoskeleton-regulatory complex protein pan1 n=1 Tax=Drosophila pseudoobscura pseudoobscura TaxID=46245 RepID=A0A6I8UD15_DROPS|nr:actin cytoskeleton-regulatory complex protein pan1 [Drosophila pseudoobscura]